MRGVLVVHSSTWSWLPLRLRRREGSGRQDRAAREESDRADRSTIQTRTRPVWFPAPHAAVHSHLTWIGPAASKGGMRDGGRPDSTIETPTRPIPFPPAAERAICLTRRQEALPNTSGQGLFLSGADGYSGLRLNRPRIEFCTSSIAFFWAFHCRSARSVIAFRWAVHCCSI
jgi:hypothetical protein